MAEFWHKAADGQWYAIPHAAQKAVMKSSARVAVMQGGTGSGKSILIPIWALDRLARFPNRGGLAVAPKYSIADKQLIPHFQNAFETRWGYGEYVQNPRRIRLKPEFCRHIWGDKWDGTEQNIFFGFAEDPTSLVSIHAGWAACDEFAHPDFRRDSWHEIQNRVGESGGPILANSTPHYWGWVKDEVIDKAGAVWSFGDEGLNSPEGIRRDPKPFVKADGTRTWPTRPGCDPKTTVYEFPSILNPHYSREEDERIRGEVKAGRYPQWKYQRDRWARFTRPEGAVFDAFDRLTMVVAASAIGMDETWERYLSVDFGGVNFVALFWARKPGTTTFYLYDEYKGPEIRPWPTPFQHVEAIRRREPRGFVHCVGGSWSEGQWRHDFKKAGLDIRPPPIKDRQVGFERVNGLMKPGNMKFSSKCQHTIKDVQGFVHKLDEAGQPMDEIEDEPMFHFCAATRYFATWAFGLQTRNSWKGANLNDLPVGKPIADGQPVGR